MSPVEQITRANELPAATLTAQRRPCDSHGCAATATTALRFHNQAGHVHDCNHHTAELREWCDVAESVPLPCPWTHGTPWVDVPRELV